MKIELTLDDNLTILKELYPQKTYFPKEGNYSCCLGIHRDKIPSLGINKITGKWHCFSCGESGITLDSLYYKVFHKHYKTLQNQNNISNTFSFIRNADIINEIKQAQDNYKYYCKPIINKEILFTYDDLRNTSNKYLLEDLKIFFNKRAFNLKDIEYLNKRYNADIRIIKSIDFLLEDNNFNKFNRTYTQKILFPQRDYLTKEILNYEMRNISILSSDPKVIRPSYCKSKFLNSYSNLDYNKPLYLHEGLMDCLVFLLHCEENTACTNGCELTDEILEELTKFNEIVVIPDNDKAGYSLVNQIFTYINQNLKRTKLYMLNIPNKFNIKDTTDLARYLKNNNTTLNDFYYIRWRKEIKEVKNNILYLKTK